jgi:hypothetical protein
VYVFFEGAAGKQSAQEMTRSFDGGKTFETPRAVASVVDVGVFDPVQQDVSFDGVTGARTDWFPIVDIDNGAPSGAGATNVIAMTWSDARAGLNHEQALVELSGDGGSTWTAPVNAAASGDRPDFPSVVLAPTAAICTWCTTASAPHSSTTTTPRACSQAWFAMPRCAAPRSARSARSTAQRRATRGLRAPTT